MKKTITLLLAFLVCFSLSAKKVNPFTHKKTVNIKTGISQLKSAQAELQPTSILFELWDGSAWYTETTMYYEYETISNGTVIIITTDAYQQKFTYNDYGELIEMTTSSWNGSSWTITSGYKYDFEYDSNDNIISEIYSDYNQVSGWVEHSGYKTEYTYTGDLLTSEIYYDRTGGAWIPQSKTEWFYDTNDILDGAFEYTYNGSDYELSGRYINVSWFIWDASSHVDNSYPYTYTFQEYSGSGDIYDDANYTNSEKMVGEYPDGTNGGVPVTTIETYQIWDTDWVNDYRWTWTQSVDTESELEESWNGSAWISSNYYEYYHTALMTYIISNDYTNGVLTYGKKSTETYDQYGNLTEEKNESHTGDENWQMDIGQLFLITYQNGTSNISIRITQNWDEVSTAYVNYSRETYSYTPTDILEKPTGGFDVYPTNFDSRIYINSSENSFVSIYNISGSLILKEKVFVGINYISTTNLKSGYYILKVGDETFRLVKNN
ncbi:T9SS type A sorting domain-containing protein [Plebeiibacterium sediminum]|uniref:T9SS type A sorting domain-containing protein n=1 Tax=Plebeiibacterium sediminum TaxID=2992112 RepID=A0AAE3SH44_9BACT|nr:T9SS type A sorting domain-containing protein [Plebeiobacterium sediminum]MCW3789180.1 T9SS type A sorting domain-containing protein [Plebeiobacterium sediminum]